MKQSAVEWLINELDLSNDGLTMRIINKAKEMEKQQQDKFAIDFFNWCNSQDTGNLLHDLIMVGEVDKNVTIEQMLEIFKKIKI